MAVAYDKNLLFVLETSGKEIEVYDVTHTAVDTVWVDDAIPVGGIPVGNWDFSPSNPVKYAGNLATAPVPVPRRISIISITPASACL